MFLRAWPVFLLPAGPRSRAPPAPLFSHGAGRRPTNAHLRRSRAAAGCQTPLPFLRVVPPAPDPPPLSFSVLPCGHAQTSPPFSLCFGAKAVARLPFPNSLPPHGYSRPGAPYPSPSLLRGRVPLPGVRFRCPSPEFAENSPCCRCSATPVSPTTPPLARCMLCGPLLLVPATSSHLDHMRHRVSRRCGDRALCGRRVPRSQPARPASGPRARPGAEAACRAKRTASLRGRGLRAESQPNCRVYFRILFRIV
jgi:hypothetical protein